MEWLTNLITHIYNQNGLVGLLLLLFVADRLKLFEKAKKYWNKDEDRQHKRVDDIGENHVHRRMDEEDSRLLHETADKVKDMENHGRRLAGVENEVGFEKQRLDKHLEKEALEDVMNTKIEGRIAALENDTKHLFNQNATIFEKFDKLGEKMDNKFDTLTKLILEQK